MNTILTIPVSSDNFRRVGDPVNRGKSVYHAFVQIRHLPSGISMKPNPRAHEVDNAITRIIYESLTENTTLFHLLNRGITLSASEVEYENKREILRIKMLDDLVHGDLDGGNTYKAIERAKKERGHESPPPPFMDAYVKLEILTGVEDDIVELAEARNTSAQVKTFSLANLAGKFEWIKDAMKDEPFSSNIAYREGEDKEVNVVDIICLMTLFHPKYGSTQHPIKAYTSKKSCLDDFQQEFDENGTPKPAGYLRLKPVLVEILKLYDHVHAGCREHYKALGGITRIRKEEPGNDRKGAREGRLRELGGSKELHFLGGKVPYSWPTGYLYPMLGALRALLDTSGKRVHWLVDPFDFFNEHGRMLVEATLERSAELGRNPNAVGKSKGHWQQLYGMLKLKMLEERISTQAASG
ncbi:MAG: AIPR family protein [Acidobacteria bacterium]|nr:AIPR family protein [Acidobacteriota bacterium]